MIKKTFATSSCQSEFLYLSLPLLISNIFQLFYNTVDCFIAGNYLDVSSFAALGIAGTVMNLFLFIIIGCCNGISIVFAQLYGKKDIGLLRQESFLSLFFGMLFTCCLTVIGLFCLSPLLDFLSTPMDIQPLIMEYLSIILCFLFVSFLYNWCTCLLRAISDVNITLYSLLISILLNILLDMYFVLGLQCGIAGIAYATVLAQSGATLFCLWYLKQHYPSFFFTKNDMVYHPRLFSQTLRYGCISALHQSSLYIGKLCIQGAINTMGTDGITAYSLTMQIEGLINSFGDSGCTAMSIMVAQNVGAGNKQGIKKTFHAGMKIMGITSILGSLGMFFLSQPLFYFYLPDVSNTVAIQADHYMKWISLFYIFCFIGNSFVGLYKGLGMVHIPLIGTMFHISLRVLLTYMWIDSFQISALAFASGIGWICVVVYQFWMYQKIKKKDIVS